MIRGELTNFHIQEVRYGLAILENATPQAAQELVDAIKTFSITDHQIIEGGGGLASSTKDLRCRLEAKNWNKINIREEHIIDGTSTESESHEIDHFREIDGSGIGLEIEWNAKPTHFDRDLACLSNFHRINKINLGIIITRGPEFEEKLNEIYLNWVTNNIDEYYESIMEGLNKNRSQVEKRIEKDPENKNTIIAKSYYTSKYGSSTTTWTNLIKRIESNQGYPAPLVLLGIKPSVFG